MMKPTYLILCCISFTLLLTSCRVQREAAPVVLQNNANHSDSVAINFSDTVILRINEISGDTAFIEKIKWRTVERLKVDSVYVEKPVTLTEYKPYVPEWCWYLSGIALVIILLWIGKTAFWIYRKFVLHI